MLGRDGVLYAAAGFAAGLVMSSVVASVAASAVHYRLGSGGPLPLAVEVPDLIALWAGLVGAAVMYTRTRGSGRFTQDFGYRVAAWWDLPLGAGIGLASQFGLIPLLYLPFEHLDHNLSKQLGQPATKAIGGAHSIASVVVVVVFLGVGAPLVEELFFRGLLLRSLAAWVSAVPAVLISGLLFALAHFEALQFAGLAAFGVVLGALAWRTRRLGPSVAAHMAFNVVAVLTVVHLS